MTVAWLLLAVAVVMLLANALFVAAEFSLVTVDRTKVTELADAGDQTATGVLAALRTLSTQLSSAQLGITVTSLIVGFLAEPSLATLLRGPLATLGISPTAATGVAVTIALLVATGVQMVMGELVPKNLAIARPWPVAARVAGPQRAFTRLAGGLIRLLNGNANAIVRALGMEPQEELASARAPQELQSLVRRSAEVGTLPTSTAALLARGLEFGARSAVDAMTPRVSVQFVEADASVTDVLAAAQRSGLSRFPVTGSGGADDIVGTVDIRQALRVPRERRASTTAREVAVQPVLVPEAIELDTLLRELRGADSNLAIVIDEYGGTAGIVTLEDLIEELVGDVEDEHDPPASRVRLGRDGAYIVTGLLRPDEVRDLGVDVPDDDGYDTIAGFIADALDRLPDRDDEVTAGDWILRVVKMDGLRVDRVKLTPVIREPDDAEAPDVEGAP